MTETCACPLDKGDVQVVPMDMPECQECGEPATHVVQVDWRNAGQAFGLGIYCEECAERLADRLREALPEPIPDPPTAWPRLLGNGGHDCPDDVRMRLAVCPDCGYDWPLPF